MNQPPLQTIVFTDLDGTLLDDSYDLNCAAYMLNGLRRRGVLTVPASSKTQAELESLQALLDYDTPLICENGAGIVWPESIPSEHQRHADAHASYAQICQTLRALRDRFGFKFKGFADLSADDVCALTGLDGHGARLAQQRMASEPVSWSDSPERLAEFRARLTEQELTLQKGGRFWHVMSAADKGLAAGHILAALNSLAGRHLPVIACGDSPNDLPMMTLADGCVLFPQRDGGYLPLPDQADKLRVHAKAAGGLAWLEALNQILNDLPAPATPSRESK